MHRIIKEFNATYADYPHTQLIHHLVEEQVDRTPDAVAVVCEGRSLTYAQLNSKSNQLAHYLREKSIGPDRRVGICLERSLEMVIGLLGILKSGGAYVPLDPGYPQERLAYMVADADPPALLTQRRLVERLPKTTAEVLTLDGDWSEIAQRPSSNLVWDTLGLHSRHLAYVIYTSGSTGLPKGAMNEHRGVVNRLRWGQDTYQLGLQDRVLQKTPFSFDVSVWEFFGTLMAGARLIVARPEGHKNPTYLLELIEKARITMVHFVPSMLQIFLDQCRPGACASLRQIVCSGEELPAALQRKCFRCLPQVRLSNLYGPTETAVEVTAWECDPADSGLRVPIGRPIANTQIFVLDPAGQKVPIGVAGEIHIAGVSVGRGYLNRPDLTAQRFVSNPFTSDRQETMYKTGDLGRWRMDGAIEYLGRNDHQVKIRGFRVELGEIEAQVALHPQVKEVVVLAREDAPGEKRLVAYVTLRELSMEMPVGVDALRAHLQPLLPEYMVPSAFVMLSSFPLTPNGKLDRRALPAPDPQAFLSSLYEPPQGEVEEILAAMWRALLRVERVGRQDNFFALGGESLQGAKLISTAAERFGVDLSDLTVFQYPSLLAMAGAVAKAPKTNELQEGAI